MTDAESSHRDGHDDVPTDTSGHEDGPAIVIYMVNPFTYGKNSDQLNRQAMIGLLKCYQEVLPNLPESMQNSVYLQVGTLLTGMQSYYSATVVASLFCLLSLYIVQGFHLTQE